MSPGERLDLWYKRYDPCLGAVLQAIVTRRISRKAMLSVADELEKAAQELRGIVGADRNDSEQCGASD